MEGRLEMDLIAIIDKESLRKGYKFLKVMERMQHDPAFSFSTQERIAKWIIDLKREMREYSHRNSNERMAIYAGIVESRLVWSYGIDGYVELITFPDGIASTEFVEAVFDDFIKVEYRPTYYDCTGQAFTNWHKTFKRNGRYCIYHSVGIDV